MSHALSRRTVLGALVGTSVSLATGIRPARADKSAVKMQRWQGTIDHQEEGPSLFTMEGQASHLGRFTAAGEVSFGPTPVEGVQAGNGPVVFTAANGDLLVGETTWIVDENNEAQIHFAWRDSVTFGDGETVHNTGRFVSDRPPGLVVIAIIAILIGLLLPASIRNG